jgi:AmmeMemoRadiSam system protein A
MPFLSETDRHALLGLARRAITEGVLLQKPLEPIPNSGVFAERRGAFVTLHVGGRLRGCIGMIEPLDPLGEVVAHCAAGAALHDPRFSPVQAEEITQLQIEISLLSPLEPILPASIEIGKHGLLVSQAGKRGLLLPQVATEHNLSREQFLDETCRKAGLPPKSWQDPATQILAFTCEIFSDPPPPLEPRLAPNL